MAYCFAPIPSSLPTNDRLLFRPPALSSRKAFPACRWRCSAAEQPRPQKSTRTAKKPQDDAEKGAMDPIGFTKKLGITNKPFLMFLRERHKELKDLKVRLSTRFASLMELSSGYELLGFHRHRQHRVDFMEWAPGARYCSLIGDFNGWSPTENSAREGHLGRDDYGYWLIVLEDKLRDGEQLDEYFFQEYNYVDDYDKGDSGTSVDEIIRRVDEYWEPGEDRYLKSRFEVPAKLYEQMFGPNGPQTEEELGDLPDAETRYKEWKESHKDDTDNNFPRYPVIHDGKKADIFKILADRDSYKKFKAKKPPLAYWIEMRKGRKAWTKKYIPAISHGSKYRVYFNTSSGPLERVPAWATYVLPDVDENHSFAVHWEPPPESIYKWRHKRPKVPTSLRIYECHVGISGSELKITSFNEFTSTVLPHVKRAGYNAIQLIGVLEHKDYSSVGYKVTNFFAVSSRFGTPDDFKQLVDEAHGPF